MHTRTHRVLLAGLVALAGCSLAVSASAQINPEEGGVWVPPPDDTPPPQQQQTPPQQEQPWYHGGAQQQQAQPQQQQPQTQESTTQPPSDGRSDHARMVGHLAVGWMGVSAVPIGPAETVSTPAIGVRYWISELVGLDIGLGLGLTGGTSDTTTAGVTSSTPVDNAFGMLIHAGLPLALFHTQHYALLIIPEVNIGFATGTLYGSDPVDDRGRSGLLFSVGGRLGAEIHFGFMNIPNLSLQASVGLYFEYLSFGVSTNRSNSGGSNESSYGLGTTVMGEPWDIFLGSLQALYYF